MPLQIDPAGASAVDGLSQERIANTVADTNARVLLRMDPEERAEALARLPEDVRARTLARMHVLQGENEALQTVTAAPQPVNQPLVSIDRNGDGTPEIRLIRSEQGFVLTAERGSVMLDGNWLNGRLEEMDPARLGNIVLDAARALGLTAKRLDPETYIA